MTYLYIGKSSHANEPHSYTIGITANCHRRAYEKHMVPVWVLPFDSRKEAQRVEKLILSWVRQHYAESFEAPGTHRNGAWGGTILFSRLGCRADGVYS